jgi:uncharacterized protein YkwD
MRVFAILLVLLCAACVEVPDDEPPVPAPKPADPKTLMWALEQRIGILVAEERGRLVSGAKPLMIDPELATIARTRAADMAAKNYFAHAAPNGDTSASILMAEDASFQGLLGENMAAVHYTPALGVDVDRFARQFLDIWMNSPAHRANLTYALYNRIGIGAAVNGDTVYVTELFATDLGLGPHVDRPAGAPTAATGPVQMLGRYGPDTPDAPPSRPYRKRPRS